MNKIILYKLSSTIILSWLLSSCSSDEANAESPCPTSINSAKVILLDSISNERISSATVVLAGQIFDNSNDQTSNTEITINYDNDLEAYHLPYEINGVEIDSDNLILYTADTSYHSNVSKPSYFDIGCTELEYTIYLCPNGTACR